LVRNTDIRFYIQCKTKLPWAAISSSSGLLIDGVGVTAIGVAGLGEAPGFLLA
jgi:hypothetical protein